MILIVMEELNNASESYVLPEKWCVKATPETLMTIAVYWDSVLETTCYQNNSSAAPDEYGYHYWYSHNVYSGDSMYAAYPGANHVMSKKKEGFTEITFEQFKQYVLKENTIGKEKPVEKELIGYKLKEGYEQSEFKKLLQCLKFSFDDFETNGIANYTILLSELTKMGALGLWFEPVYKELFQKGDWVIGNIGSTKYIGLYSSSDKMSEWMCIDNENTSEEWFNNQGTFGSISRLATPEEIKEAKKYKYKAQAEAMFAKVDAEIERLFKGIKPKENINSNQVMFSREIPMDLCLGDKICMSWEIYAAAHKLLK